MEKKQFSGKNIEEALASAASDFRVDPSFICYHILQNKGAGLLSKLFQRSIKIEAWVESSREDLRVAAREVVKQVLHGSQQAIGTPHKELETSQANSQQKMPLAKAGFSSSTKLSSDQKAGTERSPRKNREEFRATVVKKSFEEPDVQAAFEEYLSFFFNAMDISREQIDVIPREEGVIAVCVADNAIEGFLSRSDKLSLSFEHIFKRVVQKKIGDIAAKIVLEAGGSEEKRQERLVGMAKTLAEKVRKTGKSVVLSSKSNQERRVIHLALDGMPGIATRSIGVGDKRRLVIYSTAKKGNNKNSNPLPSRRKERQGGERPSAFPASGKGSYSPPPAHRASSRRKNPSGASSSRRLGPPQESTPSQADVPPSHVDRSDESKRKEY